MNRQQIISLVAVLVVALSAAGAARAAGGIGDLKLQVEGSPSGGCWSKELERSKGTFPYARRLFLYTVWCGASGRITYRSSTVRTSHDFLCWTDNGPFQAKTAGGAGFGFVDIQAWAEVGCHAPTLFPAWHDSLMMRIRYSPSGGYTTLAYD